MLRVVVGVWGRAVGGAERECEISPQFSVENLRINSVTQPLVRFTFYKTKASPPILEAPISSPLGCSLLTDGSHFRPPLGWVSFGWGKGRRP